jgi:hypothetical protein
VDGVVVGVEPDVMITGQPGALPPPDHWRELPGGGIPWDGI